MRVNIASYFDETDDRVILNLVIPTFYLHVSLTFILNIYYTLYLHVSPEAMTQTTVIPFYFEFRKSFIPF